jgi:hypothetical protein
LDDDVKVFVDELLKGGPQAVASAIRTSSAAARDVLRAFAERMASLAVRRRDQSLLKEALVANVVAGLSNNDRESLLIMPLIEDAAERLEVPITGLFEDVARVVGHPGTTNLVLWLSRKPENRTLASMGYEVGADAGGFRYVRTW